MSDKEILEFVINRESYLTIKPEFSGSWHTLCVNYRKEFCKKCQQEQCDAAGGGMPDFDNYKWLVIKNEDFIPNVLVQTAFESEENFISAWEVAGHDKEEGE